MKNNKYIIFASIGFELIALILAAIYGGEYLVTQGAPSYLKAFLIVAAFVVWFISLFAKLRSMEKNKDSKDD